MHHRCMLLTKHPQPTQCCSIVRATQHCALHASMCVYSLYAHLHNTAPSSSPQTWQHTTVRALTTTPAMHHAKPSADQQPSESTTDNTTTSDTSEHAQQGADDSTNTTSSNTNSSNTNSTHTTKPAMADRIKHVAAVVWREVREAVAPQEEITSALRAPAVGAAPPGAGATTSDLVLSQRSEGAWEKRWRGVQEKVCDVMVCGFGVL